MIDYSNHCSYCDHPIQCHKNGTDKCSAIYYDYTVNPLNKDHQMFLSSWECPCEKFVLKE